MREHLREIQGLDAERIAAHVHCLKVIVAHRDTYLSTLQEHLASVRAGVESVHVDVDIQSYIRGGSTGLVPDPAPEFEEYIGEKTGGEGKKAGGENVRKAFRKLNTNISKSTGQIRRSKGKKGKGDAAGENEGDGSAGSASSSPRPDGDVSSPSSSFASSPPLRIESDRVDGEDDQAQGGKKELRIDTPVKSNDGGEDVRKEPTSARRQENKKKFAKRMSMKLGTKITFSSQTSKASRKGDKSTFNSVGPASGDMDSVLASGSASNSRSSRKTSTQGNGDADRVRAGDGGPVPSSPTTAPCKNAPEIVTPRTRQKSKQTPPTSPVRPSAEALAKSSGIPSAMCEALPEASPSESGTTDPKKTGVLPVVSPRPGGGLRIAGKGKQEANAAGSSETENFEGESDEDPTASYSSTWTLATVLFDYEADAENKISLYEGETVYVISEDVSGWWIGACGVRLGFFPSNFVQLQSTPTGGFPQVTGVLVSDFTTEHGKKFEKGVSVRIISHDSLWYTCIVGDAEVCIQNDLLKSIYSFYFIRTHNCLQCS